MKKIGVVLAVHCRNCRSVSLMIWSRLSKDRNQRQIQITLIIRIFDDIHDHIVNEHIDSVENYLKIFSKNMKSGQIILNIRQLNICRRSGLAL